MMKGNKSDRFILSRSSERDLKINRYNVKNSTYSSPFVKSGSISSKYEHRNSSSLTMKTISPFLHNRQKIIKEELYFSLLKSQLFSTNIKKGIKKKGDYGIDNNFLNKKRKKSGLQSNDLFNTEKRKTFNVIEDHTKGILNLNEDNNPNDSFNLFEYVSEFQKEKPGQIKVLDAPGLIDDFYLHLLSWSKKDIISVALGSDLYLLYNQSHKVKMLNSFLFTQICSCSFLEDPSFLALGLNNGELRMFDIEKEKELITVPAYTERLSVIETIPLQENIFTTGSKDSMIKSFDKRQKMKPVQIFKGHKQEICGIKWSPDGKTLASGSNDNKLIIWKIGYNKPFHIFNNAHSSAIRALDWSHQKYNFLGTGGGIQDRTIKVWNCTTMEEVNSIDTESQICNLSFSKKDNEIVTTHGFTDNLVNIWKLEDEYKSMKLVESLKGHKNRVLYLATSPNLKTIATGSGDETIRLWNVFSSKKEIDINSKLNTDTFSIR